MRRGRFAALGASVLLVGGLIGQAAPILAATPPAHSRAARIQQPAHGTAAHKSSSGPTNVRAQLAKAPAALAFDPAKSNAVLNRLEVAQAAAVKARQAHKLVPAIGPLPLCTLGCTVWTSTAPKAGRARTKYSPPAATMARSSKTTSQRHLPRRGVSRSIRKDANSSFRSRINGVQLSLDDATSIALLPQVWKSMTADSYVPGAV